MIFLFDKFKKLKGTVRNRHTISLLYERERNGLYTVSAEIPLKITDKKTVYNYHKKVKDSDFLGHYDREGRFQLHKIASVDIEDSSIYIKGVHLFFDEAKAGAIIQERRFRQSEIINGARVAFDSIGWSVVDFDVSDTKDYIFYNVSPLEARAILIETFGFEFDYWLDFDGKNIRNKQISVKREMGKDSNKRYNYGHNVLNIKVEQDYSEIYTAVIGRGKGEDLGDDAYGRRIEYTDVEWKTPTNPMNKPKGSRTLHDENATQLFGYHEDGKVSPRTKVEIFEDIEEPEELLQASYEWLKENSVPKAVFSLKVPDGDGLDLGDKVHVIYRDIDLVKHTRVTKVIDDLVSGYRDVEFGDTAYFKTDRRLSGVKSELKRVGGSMSSRISRLKAEFDRRFDNEVQQWKDDFEQAVIDAEAAVEVMRVTMTEEFEAAQKEFEDEFNQAVADAKKHADETAEAKAQEVQANLETFEAEHSQIISDFEESVSSSFESINSEVLGLAGRLGTLGDSLEDVEGTLINTKTQLETQITDARADLEESISNTRTELENKIDATEEALGKVGEDLGNAKTDLQRQLDEARAELDGLEGTEQNITNIIQTITNIEGELSSKVEQTEVDALKGTVTRQGTLLTQTADEVSSKAEKSVVDTLTGRVSNAESSVTQNANEIAKKLTKSDYDEDKKATDAKITQWSNTASETAEGLTRVIGRVSQTEKGVETAQTRIEAEAGRIDGVLSRTSKVEGQVRDAQLAIEANADGLALRATKTEVEQAIDGIEIGGRNYLTVPKDGNYDNAYRSLRIVDGVMHWTQKTSATAGFTIPSYAPDSIGTYTFSFKTDNDENIRRYVNTPKSGTRTSTLNISEQGEIFLVSLTYKNFNPNSHIGFYGGEAFEPLHEVKFWDFKLEKGNKATDWSPAPEDIDASISEVTDRVTTAEAELVVQAGEISQKATQSELDRVTGRVSTAETSITQNANEIARRLVKSDYDTDKAKIDGDITKWSNLTTETAEGLEQSISRLSTAEGKVTKAQADIKANADEIATKVSNSQFNSLSGKVSDNTSAITQTANEVKSKVTQAEVDYSMTHIDNGRIKTMKDVANYFNSQSSVTGALLIKTRITGRAMARVFIKGYDYTTDSSNIDAVVSFYNYSESFLQYSYTSTGSKAIERVRLFRDSDGNACILLNDFDSTWKYPAIMVDRFDMSYSTDFAWGEGWEMSVITSMPSGMTLLTEVNGQDYGSIVSKHETDIIQNAKEITLKASQSELNKVTGRVSTAEANLSVQAGEISSVVGKVDGNTKSISSVLQDTKSIKSTIASIEKDLVSQGSEIDQALDSITGKVWLGDVGGRNLLPKTDLPNDRDHWRERGTDVTLNQTSTRGLTDYLWMNRYGGEANRYIAVLSPLLTENVVEGHEYTIQFKTVHRVNVNELFTYVYLMNEDGTTNQPTPNSSQTVIEIGENDYNGTQIQLHTITLKANFSGRARILIGTHTVDSGSARFYVKEPKIEKGKATAYSRAPEDFLQMSELKITPDYWQLGSTRIDGDSVSSVLRGSPDSIDAIVSEMNLTGNLNVKGQIESIAMSAVRGDFADLFAARVKAGDVDIDNISGRTAWFERLYTLNANIDRLTSQFAFIDEVKALSITAVEANIGSIRSKILTSDVIQASHIKAGTTLIDKIFSSTAMFERMMSKSAFVNTLNTVSIDTDQLTIRRADGGVLMSNGTQKFGSPIITKPFPDTGVEFDGTNYMTTLRSRKTFERAYGEHAGRYANFSFRIGLDWTAKSASTYMRVVIRPGTTPSGVTVPTVNERFIVYRGEQRSETINVRLPVPTFGAISWTLEFYREGENIANPVTIRSERCWISA